MSFYLPKIFEADGFEAVITVLQSALPDALPRPLSAVTAAVYAQSGGVLTTGTATILAPSATVTDPDCGKVRIVIPPGAFVPHEGSMQLRLIEAGIPRTVWAEEFKVYPSIGP
jgi:hypothetical protein